MLDSLVHQRGKGLASRNRGFVFFALAFITSFFLFVPSVSAFSVTDLTASFDTPVSLTLFIVLGVVCLFLLLVGLGVPLPYFSVVGFFLVFVLGGILQAGSLELPTGELEYVYGNNFTGYHWDYVNDSTAPSQTDREAYLFHEDKEFELIAFNQSHIIGLFLMVISVFAMFFSLFVTIGSGGGSY